MAGVTLLALGNGAPDVSAVYNAIKIGPSEGIPLSLGELTGGGMFVQSVVVGRILFLGSSIASGKKEMSREEVIGVTCREELTRDIAMYGISAAYVLWMCSRGVIFYRHVVAMLGLYCGYVALVILFEIRRYCSSPPVSNMNVEGDTKRSNSDEMPSGGDAVALIGTTAASFDEEDQIVELSPHRQRHSALKEHPDPPGVKQSKRVLRLLEKQQQFEQQRHLEKRKSLIDNDKQHPQDRSPPSPNRTMAFERSWTLHLFTDSLRELCQHFYNALYTDIWSNSELSRFQWFCMIMESPFIIVRKLVTPIPCEAEYNRSLVAYSIAISPLWVFFYLSTKMDDFDPFCNNGTDGGARGCFPTVFWPCCISFAVGCAVIKFAPKEDAASVPLHYSLPIAFYGFGIAATWIDVISDQLVNLLEFIGVILRIPAPIMGMTVLAWGNSVGDYTTNGTLAQRGLADMSMAACFAGPTFNLLVGLGCGLLTQKEQLLSSEGLSI